MEPSTQVRPIDSFILIYKIFVLFGIYKHLVKPKSYKKYVCQQLYRIVALLMIFAVDLSHIIYIYQARHDIDTVFEVMMVAIPISGFLAKYLALNLGSSRVDKINDALRNDSLFLPKNKKEEEYLTENKQNINKMVIRINGLTAVCVLLWSLSWMLKRLQDPGAQFKTYMPFETDSWLGYSLGVFLYQIVWSPWTAYGQLTIDCMIAAYYSQARTQLKLIRYNLERLTQAEDEDLDRKNIREGSSFQYRDMVYQNIKEGFVYNVKKYERVVWYIEEVDKLSCIPIGFNFFLTAFSTCMAANAMNSVGTSLVQQLFSTVLVMLVQTQLFLFCYFGELVTQESSLLTTSIYMSDWCSLSPKFRRGMLIAMVRWSRPLVPKIDSFVIIPLSLNTFIAIVRSTYSLFTVLKAAKNE